MVDLDNNQNNENSSNNKVEGKEENAIPAWIDKVLHKYKFEIKNENKKSSEEKNKPICVQFFELPNSTGEENEEYDYRVREKEIIQDREFPKIMDTIKTIFGSNLKKGCIDRLKTIEYYEEKNGSSKIYYGLKKYLEYQDQIDRYNLICKECLLQLITKQIPMSCDMVKEISNFNHQITNKQEQYVFSQQVTDFISRYFQNLSDSYDLYLWYIWAYKVFEEKHPDKDREQCIKKDFSDLICTIYGRERMEYFFPEISWKDFPEDIKQEDHQTSAAVNQIYRILEQEVAILSEDYPEADNYDILNNKITALLDFYDEKYQQRLKDDPDFKEFTDQISIAVDKFYEILKNTYQKDLDEYAEVVVNRINPEEDSLSEEELGFIKTIYGLIYSKKLPESIYEKKNAVKKGEEEQENSEGKKVKKKRTNAKFRWYMVDADTVQNVCDAVVDLAHSRSIYHYVDTNYANLGDTIEDVMDSIKYPVAHNITRMLREINLEMSTYHEIYKKSDTSESMKNILEFEAKLITAHNFFESKLQEVYDMVLEDHVTDMPVSPEDQFKTAVEEAIEKLFANQETDDENKSDNAVNIWLQKNFLVN